MNIDKTALMNRMFKEVTVSYDMMSNQMALTNESGNLVSVDWSTDQPTIVENLLGDFGMELPAFAQAVPISTVKKKSIILDRNGEICGWVTDIDADRLEVLTLSGEITTMTASAVSMGMGSMGKTVMVVMDMFSGMQGAQVEGQPDQGAMMQQMFMMSALSNSDMDPMMLAMMMQGQGGQGGMAMNPMMMMALAGKKD